MGLDVAELQERSDEELVALTLADKNNFAWLMSRYEAKLLRYINRLTNVSHEEAEDLLQEIFIKTYRYLNDFDPKLKFSSWIYRIAHNHIISYHRYRQARPQSADIEPELMLNLADDLDLPAEIASQELKSQVAQVIDSLKPEHKEVLILKYLEEQSYEELSDILAKPMGTVASLIHSAKKAFKKQWHIKYGQSNQ